MRPVSARRESGHPALRQASCMLCYSKSEGILCTKCARASAEEHRGLAGAISRLRGTPCRHCSEESVGVIAGSVEGLCTYHARDYRSMDFIPKNGFVKFGSIPSIVGR